MIIYRGDTGPDLVVAFTGTDEDGNPIVPNFSVATQIKAVGKIGSVAVFSRTTGASGTAQGVMTMPWQTGDTASAGIMKIEFEVTWPDGRIQTFRCSETVVIQPDLG